LLLQLRDRVIQLLAGGFYRVTHSLDGRLAGVLFIHGFKPILVPRNLELDVLLPCKRHEGRLAAACNNHALPVVDGITSKLTGAMAAL
jgi:hypothetical protein